MKLPNNNNKEMMEVTIIGTLSNIHHNSKAPAKGPKDKHKTIISTYNNN